MEYILNLIITLGIIGLYHYFISYHKEKGINKARKEDIGQITEAEEIIRSKFSKELEYLRNYGNLKLAALDRRLQAHQEAYTLWRKLNINIYGDKIMDVVMECQEWWSENCLYLSSEARKSFFSSYMAAGFHKEIVKTRDAVAIKESMNAIREAGDKIVSAADLPSLGIDEIKEINIDEKKPAA